MRPSMGRIVLYRLTEGDVERARDRDRSDGRIALNGLGAGDLVPAMVLRVFDDYPMPDGGTGIAVNLRLFIDGNHDGWATSVHEGTALGHWSWPPRVEG